MLADMDAGIRTRFYGKNQSLENGDPHVVFYGEVVGSYRE